MGCVSPLGFNRADSVSSRIGSLDPVRGEIRKMVGFAMSGVDAEYALANGPLFRSGIPRRKIRKNVSSQSDYCPPRSEGERLSGASEFPGAHRQSRWKNPRTRSHDAFAACCGVQPRNSKVLARREDIP